MSALQIVYIVHYTLKNYEFRNCLIKIKNSLITIKQ